MSVDRHYSLAKVRRGTGLFLIGKAASGAMSFVAFIAIARFLSVGDYAYYVAALAVVELGMALATFGLDWVAARYVPEYRVLGTNRQLAQYIRALALLQAGVYAAVSILVGTLAAEIGAVLAMPGAIPAIRLYALFLFLEGCGRMARDQMLGHLLLQGRAQAALVLRQLAWLCGLGWLYVQGGGASVTQIAIVDCIAAALGVTAGTVLLRASLQNGVADASASDGTWAQPSLSSQFALARSAYLSYLLSLAYGPQVIIFLVSRMAGPDATASFGFARNLVDQVRRYLPADLLLGLIRPALIARYAKNRDFRSFSRSASVLFVVSLVVLAPLVVLGLARGDLLSAVLGRGKFADSAVLIPLLLLVLVPLSHRRVVELLANSTMLASACARANAALIAFPLLIFTILANDWPIWMIVIVSLAAEVAFNILVVLSLHRAGFDLEVPWRSLTRSALAVILATVCLTVLVPDLQGVSGLLIVSLAAVVATVLFIWICRPFDEHALDLIRRSIGRPVSP